MIPDHHPVAVLAAAVRAHLVETTAWTGAPATIRESLNPMRAALGPVEDWLRAPDPGDAPPAEAVRELGDWIDRQGRTG